VAVPRTAFRPRTLSTTLLKAAKQFPAIVITGPRQSGKTTLVQRLFGSSHRFCSLDDPAVVEQARSDPRLLLERFAPPVILDEIQYAPELLHYVKLDIDRNPRRSGAYVITESQAFPLMQRVSESLAGRTAVLSLQSLAVAEIEKRPAGDKDWMAVLWPQHSATPATTPSSTAASRWIFRGGFPVPALRRGIDVRLWQAGYLQTYLERDVRTLRAVGDLGEFQKFLFLLAARTGALVNVSELARDVAVSAKTLSAWLSVLEASGQVVTLRPYHANLSKRLVKRPKIFFTDTGLLSYLLGLRNPSEVLEGMAAGSLFEAAVFGQLLRLLLHRGEPARIHFWRTAAGHEVDFVIERGMNLIPIEAKLTATPAPRHAAGIEELQRLLGKKVGRGLLVCLCRERFPLTRTVDAVPFGSF
jgi:hypothetical protein